MDKMDKKDKLQKAYEAVEMLKALDLPVSKDQMNALSELEREFLMEEVTPRIKKILMPIVKNMNTSFRIDISYSPETGLKIDTVDGKKSYRRSNLSDDVNTERKTRNKVGILKVKFPDGRVIQYNKASQTLVDVVETIGFEKVAKLQWRVTNQPFVARERYPHQQQERDGWYVTTHSSTLFKKKQIEDLSRRFKLKLKVELV